MSLLKRTLNVEFFNRSGEACVSINRKAWCLNRSESTALLKEYDSDRHHNSKHIKKYKNCVGASRREKVAGSKNGA
jgi:hypothetical protein